VSGGIDRFLEAARVLGRGVEVRRFPQGTKTAQAAAHAIGCEVDQIVKCLVFVAGGRPVLAMTSGANRVDMGRLAALAGAEEARRATPDEVRETTGFAIGGTPPFGHPQRLITFLDRDLMGFDQVWAGAGAPDAVFSASPQELLTATGATVADLKEA
jgi:prolyl-tRNA editing enzyme YbaK/EbsC (Cys-tRNA(Pro) deacylase)